MEKYFEKNRGCLGIVVRRAVLVCVLIWAIKTMYENYRFGKKRPFWKDTALVQVCKTPYYSTGECIKLTVKLIDNESAQINFKNGNYIVTSGVTCYFTTDYQYGKAERYVFCRSWDEDGKQWDFLPLDLVY